MTESIRTKLIRIMNLAERGSAGERQAAAHLLDSLLKKYGLTPEDLISEEKGLYRFDHVADPLDLKLFIQVAASVLNAGELQVHGSGSVRGARWLECTAAQAIEIRNQYEHYRREFRRQLREQKNKFLEAFVCSNHIYPEIDKGICHYSPEEIDHIREIREMASHIRPSTFHKQLAKWQNTR